MFSANEIRMLPMIAVTIPMSDDQFSRPIPGTMEVGVDEGGAKVVGVAEPAALWRAGMTMAIKRKFGAGSGDDDAASAEVLAWSWMEGCEGFVADACTGTR